MAEGDSEVEANPETFPHRRCFGVPLRRRQMNQTSLPRLLAIKPLQPSLTSCLPCTSSPLSGPSEQLTFSCKTNHQERGEKESYNGIKENITTLMWALATGSEPQGSRLGKTGQPLSIGGVLAPRFRRG